MIRRLLFLVALGVSIALCIRTFLFDAIYVASASMEPTLPVGGRFFVNRWVYRIDPPLRGEIIVFRSPVDHQSGYIKRVIAVAGDQIELRDKHVVLNGKLLEEPYVIYKRASERLAGDNLGPLIVPPKHVFVLGDNRDESYDSTTWRDPQSGKPIYFLSFSEIKGRLIQFL